MYVFIKNSIQYLFPILSIFFSVHLTRAFILVELKRQSAIYSSVFFLHLLQNTITLKVYLVSHRVSFEWSKFVCTICVCVSDIKLSHPRIGSKQNVKQRL